MLKLYAKGVATTQKTSTDNPLDPTGWIFQAYMRGVPNEEVPPSTRDYSD